jgi:hypothetical protein
MSPIVPRFGAVYLRALQGMHTVASSGTLQTAIYIAANNRYSGFEFCDPLRFGVLNQDSNSAWTENVEIHFCFIEHGGTFFFTHAQVEPYEEKDKRARAIRAQGFRKGPGGGSSQG